MARIAAAIFFFITLPLVAEDARLTTRAPVAEQRLPRVAPLRDGAVYFWQEAGSRIGFATNGVSVTTAALEAAGSTVDAAIATNGDLAAVVETTPTGIIQVRLVGTNAPLPAPIVVGLAAGSARPAVSWNGKRFLVMWALVSHVAAITPVDADGTVGRTVTIPGTTARVIQTMAVASTANGESVAVWDALEYDATCRTNCNPIAGSSIAAMVFDESGAPRFARAIAVTQDGRSPDIASNGSEARVIWAGLRTSGLRTATIGSDGSIGEPVVVTDAESPSDPKLAWNGEAYSAAWIRGVRFGSRTQLILTWSRLGADGKATSLENVTGLADGASFDLAGLKNGLVVLPYSSPDGIRVRYRKNEARRRPARS